MKYSVVAAMTMMASLLAGGCSHSFSARFEAGASGNADASTQMPDRIDHAPLVASYSSQPLKIDGKLDEKVWRSAKVYRLTHVHKPNLPYVPMTENARIRLAWSDTHLVVAGEFDDADILDSAQWNHQFHYQTGDTMELFLKPDNHKWYWEFYGTPRGYLTTLFYASRNRFGLLPWPYDTDSKIRVGATYAGELNDASQPDKGYVIEMAIPLAELASRGVALTPEGEPWRILITRYNWSSSSEAFQSELSSLPPLPAPNFHVYEWWGDLKLEKRD